MEISRTLTRRHLSENKSRSVMTILGIIIAVAMITAVFVTVTSFFSYFERLGYISDGKGEVTFRLISAQTVEKLKNDERVERVGIIDESEDEAGYTLLEGTIMRYRRGSMYTADHTNLEQMVSCEYEGELPHSSNEIAVEESLLKANKLNKAIGDSITMEVGRRTWINGDGEEVCYSGSYQSEENFYFADTRTVVITAILHGNKATGDYKILRGADEADLARVPDGMLSAMISLKNVGPDSYREIMRMKEEYGVEKIRLNTEVLDAHFSLRKGSSFVALLPVLIIVMICIILFSVMLINNAFSMSLAERVKYLGMLASVGATKLQKRLSVYYEGFVLGIISIPVGILAGIAGIAVTLKAVGSRMISSGLFPGAVGTPGVTDIPLSIPLWLLPCIILVSSLTIFIAALIPAQKASKIMPIDAIRQTGEITVSESSMKVPRIIGLLLGYEGELAWKNLKRNGRKGRVIIFSITASLVMFLCMNYFCKLFWEANSKSYNLPFSVFATVAYSEKDRFTEEIKGISGIEDSFGIDMFAYEYKKGSDKSPNMEIMDPSHFTKAYRRVFKDGMTLMLHLVSDEDFRALCERQGIDASKYFGDETNAVLVNNVSYTKEAKEAFTERMLGQKLFYDDRKEGNPAVVTLCDFVRYEDDPHTMGMYSKNSVTAIMPYSNYVKTVYGDEVPEDLCYSAGLVCEDHERVLEEVSIILETGGYHETYSQDVVSSQGPLTALLYVLKVFTYGFIALISLITITNILNTISTGVMQRRKEFAMLKSVGMTPAGFDKMMRLESYLYGICATLAGIPLSLLLCFLMNELLPVSGTVSPDYVTFVAAVLVVFVLIRLAMMLSMSQLKNDTIVEVLKEEIV